MAIESDLNTKLTIVGQRSSQTIPMTAADLVMLIQLDWLRFSVYEVYAFTQLSSSMKTFGLKQLEIDN